MWSYRTFVLLQSAQQLGVAETSSIRAWMTLEYVVAIYNLDEDVLLTQLQLPVDVDSQSTLRTLAEKQGLSPFQYVQVVQSAIADIAELRQEPDSIAKPSGWLATIGDSILSSVLIYGYPALGLTLFLGAIGAPVPTGLSTMLAGSLASEGHLSWQLIIALAVAASVLGDLVGYGLGRVMSGAFLERHGRWFGYTPASRERAETMFGRWGPIAVLLTRTLASHFSSVVIFACCSAKST
jgi:membrane protein YqaA with SNARE-associated domain